MGEGTRRICNKIKAKKPIYFTFVSRSTSLKSSYVVTCEHCHNKAKYADLAVSQNYVRYLPGRQVPLLMLGLLARTLPAAEIFRTSDTLLQPSISHS